MPHWQQEDYNTLAVVGTAVDSAELKMDVHPDQSPELIALEGTDVAALVGTAYLLVLVSGKLFERVNVIQAAEKMGQDLGRETVLGMEVVPFAGGLENSDGIVVASIRFEHNRDQDEDFGPVDSF